MMRLQRVEQSVLGDAPLARLGAKLTCDRARVAALVEVRAVVEVDGERVDPIDVA